MTDVVRIVACYTDDWDDKEAFKMAQAATRQDYQHCWSNSVPGSWWITNHLSKYDDLQIVSLLLWQGPLSEFILFRLTENSGLVVAHEDVDLASEDYQQLVIAAEACDQTYKSLNLAPSIEAISENNEIRSRLELHSAVAATLFSKLVPTIMQKLKLKI